MPWNYPIFNLRCPKFRVERCYLWGSVSLYLPFWGRVLLYLRSPKGGCCSISDDLSCFCIITGYIILPPWTDMSRKYLGKDKCIFRGGGGVVQDIIYDVMAPLLAWRCHRQRRHDVVLWTPKTTLKSDYLLKLKAWEKNNQLLQSGRDKGIPSSCPWFATSTTRQASSWIANHGHLDGIPLSLPECSDRFYYSFFFRW